MCCAFLRRMIIFVHGREVVFDIVRGHSYFSNMTKLNVAISEEDIGWAKSRVAAGEIDSVESYFSQLAKRDKAEAEEAEWLQGEIDKGLASGVDPRSSSQIFADVRAKYLGENGFPGRWIGRSEYVE